MAKAELITKAEASPEETGEIIKIESQETITLFGTSDPVEVIQKATQVANALADIVEAKKLYTQIGPKKFPNVEAWTLIGTMLGVFPVVEWTRPIHQDNDPSLPIVGYEARVVARTLGGAVVGAAEHQCTREEATWKNRDAYALRSMAQTRATSKALRGPLDFIMKLAGYVGTPAEEAPQTRSQRQDAAVSFDIAVGIRQMQQRIPRQDFAECVRLGGITKADLSVGDNWIEKLDPKMQVILHDLLVDWEETHEVPFYDTKL